MWTENIYKRMLVDFFTPAFRSISMTRCVSVSRYYDTVHDYKYYGNIQTGNYQRSEMVQKNYKHLRLMMERLSLSVSEDKEGTENDALFRPTIFEEELPRLMVSEYNRVAQTVGAVLAPVGYCHYMLEDKQSWIKPESEDNRV